MYSNNLLEMDIRKTYAIVQLILRDWNSLLFAEF